jgi:hypothetical protein
MLPTIISFFTNDWEYPKHARRLKYECKKLKLNAIIENRPSAGGYLENTCLKPFYIREMLLKLQHPVLWVDVDGSIYQQPVLFDGLDADVSFCEKPPHHNRKWHVGTMWFNYTPATLAFMDKWCEMTGNMTDESALEDMHCANLLDDLRIVAMPKTYHEYSNRGFPVNNDTVISHRISTGKSKMEQRPIWQGDSQSRASTKPPLYNKHKVLA